MLAPYNFNITNDGAYSFKTSSGITYESIFFEDENAFALGIDVGQPVHQFSFYPTQNLSIKDRLPDIRIQLTITKIIIDFYIKNPDAILMFLCLEDDRLALSRLKLFKKWFSIYNSEPVKTMFSLEITDVLMIGLLMDANHSKINDINSIYELQIEELDLSDKAYTSNRV